MNKNLPKNFSGVKKILEKQQYAVVGNHSAVQICMWNKNSLNKRGSCWKEKFYGISAHRCCQMSPSVMWCENSCLHCWRPIELNLGTKLPKNKIDSPKEILEKIIEARKKLLMGFKGNKNVSEKKFNEAIEPTLFTMSLSGEPTIYPYLGDLFKEIRKRKAVSFLVTNGLNPDVIKKIAEENKLPTQLTISMNAPNEKLFKFWHNSKKKDAWIKFNESLDVMKKLKGRVRRAIRLTLVRVGKEKTEGNIKLKDVTNMADENISEYAELIRKANPDFIHVKSFKSLGWSRTRFGYDKQPMNYEVKRFAEKLQKELEKEGYKIVGSEIRSVVFILAKSKKGMKINWNKV